jgi:hypothetical protein
LNQGTAFVLAEGRLQIFQIVETGHRRDTRGMTPIWLVRFNDLLPWLNPVLGLVAGVLAAMVIASAAGHLPVQPTRSAAPMVRVVREPAPAACQKAALPPEWQELTRYD